MSGANEPETSGQTKENDSAGLKGWAYVEDWMTKLDKGMVSDFNEDINTLLTFAGLFSAVLAGFLIQLYGGLQPSNNQETNNILTQVSGELRHISHQLVNSSLSPVDIPLPSPMFQASASIVWINTLWFLSLDLSLAAALFGMICKQWLREYLQWTTMSGLSETQIALRQGRYEAFNDWKTPVIIASMPVLLELALILFLLGMEVLLWTLNAVVFGVCTVAVVTLIALVIVVTVLPVFRARCPYKSPVGWLCVLAMRSVHSLRNQVMCLADRVSWCPRMRTSFQAYRYKPSNTVEKDWRERDLALHTMIIGVDENPQDVAAAGRRQMLSRALWWIRETSQDQRLLHAINECVGTYTANSSRNTFAALAADFLLACEQLDIEPTKLVPSIEYCTEGGKGDLVIDINNFAVSSMRFRLKAASSDQWEARELDVCPPPSVCIWIANALVCDLLAVVARYSKRYGDVNRFGRQTDYFLQASLVLSGLLAQSAVWSEHHSSVATDRLIELFDHFFLNYDRLPIQLRPLLPLLVTFLELCDYWLLSPLPPISDLQRTRFALRASSGDYGAWSEDECSLFARLAQYALREWETERGLDNTNTLLPQLLNNMTTCVIRCLDQCWKDCAMPAPLFWWTARLRALFDPKPTRYNCFSGQYLPPDLFPHALIEALEQYDNAGLVTFSSSSSEIAALVEQSASLNPQRSTLGEQVENAADLESPKDDTTFEQACPQTTSFSESSAIRIPSVHRTAPAFFGNRTNTLEVQEVKQGFNAGGLQRSLFEDEAQLFNPPCISESPQICDTTLKITPITEQTQVNGVALVPRRINQTDMTGAENESPFNLDAVQDNIVTATCSRSGPFPRKDSPPLEDYLSEHARIRQGSSTQVELAGRASDSSGEACGSIREARDVHGSGKASLEGDNLDQTR